MHLHDIDAALILSNNTPVDDFCGLTATEMHRLLYNPLEERSPLAFRREIDDAVLDRVPFFRLTEEFLKIVQREGSVKLTATGALQRKVLHELYAMKFIPEEYIESGIVKLSREQDSIVLFSMHFNTELAHLIKQTRGRVTLTKEGTRLLKREHRQQLFEAVFAAFALRFGWSSNDGYCEFPVGQYGWGHSVYLLTQFGDKEQPLQFYANKYLLAFPTLLDHFKSITYGTPLKNFTACYSIRVFSRFLEWFGLVTVEKPRGYIRDHSEKVTRSDILDKVLYFS